MQHLISGLKPWAIAMWLCIFRSFSIQMTSTDYTCNIVLLIIMHVLFNTNPSSLTIFAPCTQFFIVIYKLLYPNPIFLIDLSLATHTLLLLKHNYVM